MEEGVTRRAFLAASAVAGIVGTVHVAADELADDTWSRTPVDVRGAVYLSTRAFNTYQMWADYDREVEERASSSSN